MKIVITSLFLLLLSMLPASAAETNDYSKIYPVKGSFTSVRDALVSAVEGHGLKVNHTNHISEMLDRTGEDLGASDKIYLNAEQIEFCSAVLSRKMMAADPRNILACPYSITVYNLPSQPDMVYVAYRKLPDAKNKASQTLFGEVEKLLNDIILEGSAMAM